MSFVMAIMSSQEGHLQWEAINKWYTIKILSVCLDINFRQLALVKYQCMVISLGFIFMCIC